MEVVVASSAGFCFGVKRAIRIARETLCALRERGADDRVFTLGPLVHNPHVIESLERDGIVAVEKPPEGEKGSLVIRTHGIPPRQMAQVRQTGFEVIDATCPLVKRIHTVVENLRSEGYTVAVIGHGDHPEVKGILGYAGEDARVVESQAAAAVFPVQRKLGAVVQTTFLHPHFMAIAAALMERAEEFRVFTTICQATTERQRSAIELSHTADLMIVVGSRQSSNTLRLVETCREIGAPVQLVESRGELKGEWLKGAARVGVTAGASTPQELIDDVCEGLRELGSA